jgi:hypothetical protein
LIFGFFLEFCFKFTDIFFILDKLQVTFSEESPDGLYHSQYGVETPLYEFQLHVQLRGTTILIVNTAAWIFTVFALQIMEILLIVNTLILPISFRRESRDSPGTSIAQSYDFIYCL